MLPLPEVFSRAEELRAIGLAIPSGHPDLYGAAGKGLSGGGERVYGGAGRRAAASPAERGGDPCLADITIGQFFPGDSLLHRMDPRMKLVLTFGYIVAVFVPQNWVGLGIAIAFLFVSVALSRLPGQADLEKREAHPAPDYFHLLHQHFLCQGRGRAGGAGGSSTSPCRA